MYIATSSIRLKVICHKLDSTCKHSLDLYTYLLNYKYGTLDGAPNDPNVVLFHYMDQIFDQCLLVRIDRCKDEYKSIIWNMLQEQIVLDIPTCTDLGHVIQWYNESMSSLTQHMNWMYSWFEKNTSNPWMYIELQNDRSNLIDNKLIFSASRHHSSSAIQKYLERYNCDLSSYIAAVACHSSQQALLHKQQMCTTYLQIGIDDVKNGLQIWTITYKSDFIYMMYEIQQMRLKSFCVQSFPENCGIVIQYISHDNDLDITTVYVYKRCRLLIEEPNPLNVLRWFIILIII